MAQVGETRTVIVAVSLEPAPDCHKRAIANQRDCLVIHVPLCIKPPRRHPKLAVAVAFDQVSFSLGYGAGVAHEATSRV